ncbi:hypothetical protein JCM14202_1717 [Agrilactobacillus composti DSM 18527 = JCM 14202]|uniref:YdeI/OmpD-associated family protein n=1 Tax=Agrilactobacillus composti TaxID=398555 RepID=UPI00042E0A81|nr:YdeI/OmpD-associated family protein [Agrilactobacillus composti]GAF39841.1 hypothetical protein JCM14202_1717 [Agrilactobacillus composti DSM 18527 = JCM 14202]
MSVKNPENHLQVKNREGLRTWLKHHANTANECWVDVTRGIPKDTQTFWYVDAVEEALCFGWIDSTYKVIVPGQPASQRLVPRNPHSQWSELNKQRCRRLIRLGKMTPAGARLLPDLDPGQFKIDPKIINALKRQPKAWAFFQTCPPLYRRVRCDTIQIKKRDTKLFQARLAKFVAACAQQKLIGQWDDGGRLMAN